MSASPSNISVTRDVNGAVNSSFEWPHTPASSTGHIPQAKTFNSTGVTGLTMRLDEFGLYNSAFRTNLTFTIYGTASGSGTATFNVVLGATSRTINVNVI
ncbi:MAG: hypothetical protein N4A45_07515 [Flavobacteriales bacterium]|jgi:hypothetical protein|nr:hypothetical protein [Flavobacteriales bacterium]